MKYGRLFSSILLGLGLAFPALAQQGNVVPPTPRNLLDNGSFAVHQRGTAVVTGATTSAPVYTAVGPDRWVLDTNVGSGAGQMQVVTATPPTGASAVLNVWRNSGSLAQPVCVMQEITTQDTLRLVGQAVSLSFNAKALAGLVADNGGTMFANVIYGTGTDQTFSVGWTATPAITPAWTGIGTAQTTLFTLNTTRTRYYSSPVNIPATATELGVQLCFTPTTTSTGGATDGFALDSVQLEVGNATPFEVRPYIDELKKAQSFMTHFIEGAAWFARGACEIQTTSIALCYVSFPQTMFLAPTMTYVTGFSALNVATAVACTANTTSATPSGNAPTPFGVMMACASSSGFSAASTAAIWGDNNGTGIINAWTNM